MPKASQPDTHRDAPGARDPATQMASDISPAILAAHAAFVANPTVDSVMVLFAAVELDAFEQPHRAPTTPAPDSPELEL